MEEIMIVEPKVKGFICTTAHPVGCKESVRRQIAICKEKGMTEGPKKVLVIGSSTGYGLASRIAVTYGYGADTIGVAFEKESNGRRTATAGWLTCLPSWRGRTQGRMSAGPRCSAD